MNGGLRRFLSSPSAAIGSFILLVACLGALSASWLAVQDPFNLASLNISDSLLPPGSSGRGGIVYHLGTDEQGRDIYSAVLYGPRISLGVAAMATLVACVARFFPPIRTIHPPPCHRFDARTRGRSPVR